VAAGLDGAGLPPRPGAGFSDEADGRHGSNYSNNVAEGAQRFHPEHKQRDGVDPVKLRQLLVTGDACVRCRCKPPALIAIAGIKTS
jgi:hypothetical protein